MQKDYGNMRNFLSNGKGHEKLTLHMEISEMCTRFDFSKRADGKFSKARREETELHNEEVRQNRSMLGNLKEAA